MNRLPTELHRLYAPPAPDGQAPAPEQASLVNALGQVRAMVLELGRPADWPALAKVWHGVQAELDLPAPAIAVSGVDGYQLWFSLAEPLPAAQALAFLESLRAHFLADIKPHRISLMPTLDTASTWPALDASSALPALNASSPRPARHARPVPAQQASSGRWSAFVAPDLAPVFADEPWLDLPPNPDGQAGLLSRIKSIVAADFQRAVDTLRPALPTLRAVEPPQLSAPAAQAAQVAQAAQAAQAALADQAGAGLGLADTRALPAGAWRAPQAFLLDVMNNDRVALGLRIEAAKALLPYFDDPRNP